MTGHAECKRHPNADPIIAGRISFLWQQPGAFTVNWTRERNVMLGSSLEGTGTIKFDIDSGTSTGHPFGFDIEGRPCGRGSIHPYTGISSRNTARRWKSVCLDVEVPARSVAYGFGNFALAPTTFSERVGYLVKEMQERGMRIARDSGVITA
jgi:hypothetical protein